MGSTRRGGGWITAGAASRSRALMVRALNVSAVTVAAVLAGANVCSTTMSLERKLGKGIRADQAGQSQKSRQKTAGLPPALPDLQASLQGTQG